MNKILEQQQESPPWYYYQYEQIMLCLTASCIDKI